MSTEKQSYHESILSFLKKGHKLKKYTQIIPKYFIEENGETVYLLRINQNNTIFDFSEKYESDKGTILSYIRDSVLFNTLNVIKLTKEEIKNGTILYSTEYDESSGKYIISDDVKPIIFINIVIPSFSYLKRKVIKFKEAFKLNLNGITDSTSDTTNIIWVTIEELFYLSRFTIAKFINVNEDGEEEEVTIDVRESGFPAWPEITKLYKLSLENGDIPYTSNFNPLANCCPEVKFYEERSIDLFESLIFYFNEDIVF
jgi:hypothetical protein